MILSADALSPAQKSVIEGILGRPILDAEAISLRAFAPSPISIPERQAAIEKLRKFLEGDRPHAEVSDEECEGALVEALRSERPAYAQMP
jgi:hypothetical protein